MVTLERILAQKMAKAISPEPLLHYHSFYVVKIAFEVPEDGELTLPLFLVDAPLVVLV